MPRATSVVSCSLLLLLLLLHQTVARQIRISRYDAQVVDDNNNNNNNNSTESPEIVATVREVTPYPLAGYRPGRAFRLPNEEQLTTTTEWQSDETTTIIPTTTDNYMPPETTTAISVDNDNDDQIWSITSTELTQVARALGYPARGYKPRVAFNLPTEQEPLAKNACNETLSSKKQQEQEQEQEEQQQDQVDEQTVQPIDGKVTPYPAAGYRPCLPFTLPTEIESEQPTNSKHPACGVSTNPLAPRPPVGSVDEPDAERVPVATNNGNGNVAAAIVPGTVARLVLPQPIIWQQPLTVQQPFVYTAHLQNW